MFGRRWMVASRRSLSLSRIGASLFSWSMVPSSGGRARPSRSASDAVPLFERRRWPCRWDRGPADRPLTSFSSRSIAPENSSPSLDSVSSVVRRSSISCSMTWLLSASEFVNDDVFENSDSRVPPWPCRIWTSDAGECVDVLRIQALDNGFQTAEQQVEVERGRGAVHRYLRAGREDLRRSAECRRVPCSDRRPG